MFNRREITPAKSWLKTQPSIELQASCCQNRFTGPPPFLYNRMCSGQPTCSCKQVLSAPLLSLQAGYVPVDPYVSQHGGQLSYQPIRHISAFHAGQSEITWVAAAMPARSGLFICQYCIVSSL